MADDRSVKLSKILNGCVGILLAIVGYFLVGRDAEVRAAITKLWEQVADIKASAAESHVQAERIITETKWIFEQDKDQEQRIRNLEQSCRKP